MDQSVRANTGDFRQAIFERCAPGTYDLQVPCKHIALKTGRPVTAVYNLPRESRRASGEGCGGSCTHPRNNFWEPCSTAGYTVVHSGSTYTVVDMPVSIQMRAHAAKLTSLLETSVMHSAHEEGGNSPEGQTLKFAYQQVGYLGLHSFTARTIVT